MMNMKSREKRFSLEDLYEIAKRLLEPGEEACNPQYTRALIEMLVDAEGISMMAKDQVAARLGIRTEDLLKVTVTA